MNKINYQESVVKLFGMTNQILENDLDQIEKQFEIDLGRRQVRESERDETYYPQFEMAVRKEASRMAEHYEIFYCLEKSIRKLISEALEEEGGKWWDSARVNENIKSEAKKNMKREADSAVTPRSTEPIDFINFGQLGEIIKENWDVFGATFNSQKAVEKVMASLNTLRGPIAHCSELQEDEILRLRLAVRDWFRLME